jgi:hypothetical protein
MEKSPELRNYNSNIGELNLFDKKFYAYLLIMMIIMMTML